MMLVLTRKIGETICIGDDVTVHILGIYGNQVKIGTRAPRNTGIHRDEVYRRIQQKIINDITAEKAYLRRQE